MAHAGGRPSLYTPELAQEICAVISTTSMGLKKLCAANDHWPSYETIYAWMRVNKEFSDSYRKAKQDQVQILVDEIVEIADASEDDTKLNKDGFEVCNSEWINRSRLRIDTRKWIAAKLVPRLYGDKLSDDKDSRDTLIEKLLEKM